MEINAYWNSSPDVTIIRSCTGISLGHFTGNRLVLHCNSLRKIGIEVVRFGTSENDTFKKVDLTREPLEIVEPDKYEL